MIKLGQLQNLKIDRLVDFGAYLVSVDDENDIDDEKRAVLLPKKQLNSSAKVGDIIEVFVYRDSMDRLISTTNKPLLTLNSIAQLTVKELTKIGAFLDWGLEKDLFLPYKQQTYRVHEGDEIPVSLYIDKSDRLCATMKIYHFLEAAGDNFALDDMVDGFVYEVSEKFGAFVAVNYKYSALIPKKEIYYDIKLGDVIEGRVTEILPDGRINLSLRQKAHIQIDSDSKKIYERLQIEGFLPFNDKTGPLIIKDEFAMSKNEFKKAIGRLYKERKILIKDDGIHLA